jgi:GxxExxY protein
MSDGELLHEKLTGSILGAFFEAYNGLKYGYLEHLYLLALERELLTRGHRVVRELAVRVMYKGEELGFQRLDMVVDDLVIVEAKSTFALDKSATRQLYNYLHATNLEVGLLLHFGPKPKFHRVICENHVEPRPDQSVRSVQSV